MHGNDVFMILIIPRRSLLFGEIFKMFFMIVNDEVFVKDYRGYGLMGYYFKLEMWR